MRQAFERALDREPEHALGWACLSLLFENEYTFGFNQRAEARTLGLAAAERSMNLDSSCQAAWRAMAAFHFFDRDAGGLRVAADRAIAINPLSPVPAHVGMLLALAGDWDRGIAMLLRAVDLNPNHSGWFHLVLAVDHYRKGEDSEALAQARRSNAPHPGLMPLVVAAAAARLGRVADVRAAFEVLQTQHPAYLDPETVKAAFAFWIWDAQLVDDLMDGFAKARALAGAGEKAPEPSSRPTSGRTSSIAVLPFGDLSEAKDQEWFCDGIAEEILNSLTQLSGLRVAARTSAFSFRGRGHDLREIGEKLQVATVLDGSVRRAGDRVRITVQLSDVAHGYQLWSERYDRQLKDVFDVQDEIARAVAERLKVTLTGIKDDRLVGQGTADIDAYQAYLQGRALLNRRGAAIPLALASFRRAVELDPGYAQAWASISQAHTVLGIFGFARRSETRPQSIGAARRAIELDPRAASGHVALACATLVHDNDRTAAQASFERALSLNPHDVQGRCWYALFYLQCVCGELDRGLVEARLAFESDPLSAYAMTIFAAANLLAGRLDEGIALAQRALGQDPDAFLGHWVLGLAQSDAGRQEDAIATLQHAADMSSRHPFAITGLALAFARLGQREKAGALYRELLGRAPHAYVPGAQLALAASAAGLSEEALAHARRAWADREPPFILLARRFPEYAALRADPRFQEILGEMDRA
jgi:TolB-like protein